MQEMTTIKVRKTTSELLKRIADKRCRRESREQVILELVDHYLRSLNAK